MKRHILLTLGNASHIVETGLVSLTVRAMRIAIGLPQILNNKSSSLQAMNLLRETLDTNGKCGFCADLATFNNEGESWHVSLLIEALKDEPIPLKDFDKLSIDMSYCYKLLNKDGSVVGATGEFNITQSSDYIPVNLMPDGSFKIAFDGAPCGFMHVRELASAMVFKHEQEKIAEMEKASAEIDAVYESEHGTVVIGLKNIQGYHKLAQTICGDVSDGKVAKDKSKIGIRKQKA